MQERSTVPEAPKLPLTPIEEYMFHDDQPDHPMTGFFRLRFSGQLDIDAVEDAIATSVARHPLLRSRVCRDAKSRLSWEEDQTFAVILEKWSADVQCEYPAAGHIDLTRSAGIRIWLVDRAGAHDLVIQVHHACSDALGLCQLIEDLLVSYALNVGAVGSEVALRALDDQRFPLRNHFGLTWGKLLGMAHRQVLGLHVVAKFFIRKAVPLRLNPTDLPSDRSSDFPSPLTFDFDRYETSCILAEAKRRMVTVNDLIAHDLFLALNHWRTQNGAGTNDDWLRFFIPINQRTPDDESLSVANIMSAVFLERTPRQLMDSESLLRSIQAEMKSVKRNQLGFLFIAAHIILKRVPRLRNHIIRGTKCVSSCVFSNLGIILSRTPLPRQDGKIAIGDIHLDGIDFIAPLRPLTGAAFCVHTYAGRLSVNLHFDPRAISRRHADDLLNCVVGQIRRPICNVSKRELVCTEQATLR